MWTFPLTPPTWGRGRSAPPNMLPTAPWLGGTGSVCRQVHPVPSTQGTVLCTAMAVPYGTQSPPGCTQKTHLTLCRARKPHPGTQANLCGNTNPFLFQAPIPPILSVPCPGTSPFPPPLPPVRAPARPTGRGTHVLREPEPCPIGEALLPRCRSYPPPTSEHEERSIAPHADTRGRQKEGAERSTAAPRAAAQPRPFAGHCCPLLSGSPAGSAAPRALLPALGAVHAESRSPHLSVSSRAPSALPRAR